jgi:hypothetical protein
MNHSFPWLYPHRTKSTIDQIKKFAEEKYTQFKLLRYQFDIQASQLQAKDREITEKDKEMNRQLVEKDKEKIRQQRNHDHMVKLLTDQKKQLEADIKTLRCSIREVFEVQMVLSDAKMPN